MNKEIHISFDSRANTYIVKFHDLVELDSLKEARLRFEQLIIHTSGEYSFSVLLDTGAHEFESLECLKYCRSFLSIPVLLNQCVRFAVVAPAQYMTREIKSNKEAAFNCYDDAYEWLLKGENESALS